MFTETSSVSSMATAAFRGSDGEGEVRRHDIPIVVDLLDHWGHIADATTAASTTSIGLPISVTFRAAAGPHGLSHLSVACPGLDLDPSDAMLAPRVVTTDAADLVLLRVPRDPYGRSDPWLSDYFVYTARPERARLDLIPSPGYHPFADSDFAVLCCGGAGGGGYAVAALECRFEVAFRLHRYYSTPDGKPGRWTSRRLTVEKPLRETVCSIPVSARRTIFHSTSKVITLGGAKGTVGWVDLWRGILVCDVLDEKPELRDMPLPMPARGNWSIFLNCCPYYSRDVSVNQSRDGIKYVEMEYFAMDTSEEPDDDAGSYHEWLACQQRWRLPTVPRRWKATVWSMPIPVTSWDDWKPQCSISSKLFDSIPADIAMLGKPLLMSAGGDEGKAIEEQTLTLGKATAYPTLSIADDDVVYFQSKGIRRGEVLTMVFAVNLSAQAVQGLVNPTNRYPFFMRSCHSTGISKHLKTTTGLQI